MSGGPELAGVEALAAEHALGVLSGRERAEAEARMSSDPEFARMVESWRARLAPLADAVAEVRPSDALWSRIERGLPANDDAAVRRSLRFWRSASIGSLSLAAASLAAAVMLANRSPTPAPPQAPAPLLNASLVSQAGQAQPLFVAAYDPVRRALIVTSLVPPGTDPAHVHQLWIIPPDGGPYALGLIEPGQSKSIPMPEQIEPMFTPGAAIAVSVEPPGGSPSKRAPSGPIAAMGKLGRI